MATATEVSGAVSEVQATATTVLAILEAADPGAAPGAQVAENVVTLIGDLVTKALNAWSTAAGTPITVDSVLALLPNQTPLTEPDAPV